MKNLLGKILLTGLVLIAANAFAVEDYSSFLSRSYKGERLIREWKIDEAYQLAGKLIKEAPGNKENKLLMSIALFYKGDYEEAVKFIQDDVPNNLNDIIKSTYEQTKNFVRKESEHFIVSYLPGKDEILVEEALIALEGAYKNIGADLGFYPESKLLVEIYPTVKSFTTVSTLTKEDIETSGTIALCKFNRLLITSPRVLLRGYRWKRTLSHEYIHYVVYNLSRGKAPIWIHEGIAKYLETRFDSDIVGAMIPSSENVLSRRLNNDSLITLEQMSPSMAKLKSGEDVQVAFAEVNTMVRYMVKTKGFDSVKKILQLMSMGKSDSQAVEDVFGLPLDNFVENWKSFMLASNLREIPGMEVTGMGVKIKSNENLSDEAIESEELKDHPSQELRNFINLGNLLRDRGRYTAASFEYEKAYTEDPFSIVALTKLAYSYMLIDKLDKALKTMNESKELFPDYVTTYYRLGLLYMAKEDYDSSIKYFLESIKINPFIPDVRKNLVHIYGIIDKKELATKQQRILDIIE